MSTRKEPYPAGRAIPPAARSISKILNWINCIPETSPFREGLWSPFKRCFQTPVWWYIISLYECMYSPSLNVYQTPVWRHIEIPCLKVYHEPLDQRVSSPPFGLVDYVPCVEGIQTLWNKCPWSVDIKAIHFLNEPMASPLWPTLGSGYLIYAGVMCFIVSCGLLDMDPDVNQMNSALGIFRWNLDRLLKARLLKSWFTSPEIRRGASSRSL